MTIPTIQIDLWLLGWGQTHNTDVIYALRCPATGATRYIGVTNNPARRFCEHIKQAKSEKSYRARWWRKVERSTGKRPLMTILATVGDLHWEAMERLFIASARHFGIAITNATSGGEGVRDPSLESRARLSVSKKRALCDPDARARMMAAMGAPERRVKISIAAKNNWTIPEYRDRVTRATKDRWGNEEFKKRMSELQKSRLAKPEAREKMLASMQIAWVSEDRRKRTSETTKAKWKDPLVRQRISEALRASWARRKGGVRNGPLA